MANARNGSQAELGLALRLACFSFGYQTRQVGLALFRHLQQRFGCAGVVDVFGQSTATRDALAHVIQRVIAHGATNRPQSVAFPTLVRSPEFVASTPQL